MLLQGFPQPNVKSILAYQVWSQTKARNKWHKSEEGTPFNKVGLDSLAPLLLLCFLDPISEGGKKSSKITLKPKFFVCHSTLQRDLCVRGKWLLLVRWELPCIPNIAAQRGVKSLKLLSAPAPAQPRAQARPRNVPGMDPTCKPQVLLHRMFLAKTQPRGWQSSGTRQCVTV